MMLLTLYELLKLKIVSRRLCGNEKSTKYNMMILRIDFYIKVYAKNAIFTGGLAAIVTKIVEVYFLYLFRPFLVSFFS